MNLNGEMISTECRFQRQRYGKSINQSHADLSSICIWLQEITSSLLPASPRAAQESAMRHFPRVLGKHRPSGTSTTDRPGWFHRLRYHGSRLSSSCLLQMPLKDAQCYNTALLFTKFTFKDLGLQVREMVQQPRVCADCSSREPKCLGLLIAPDPRV